MDNYIVYIKTDSENRIISINSSAFIQDTDGWTPIDEGIGDRYHHAQGNYLEKGLIDENGCYNYKLVDCVVVERTLDEKQSEIASRPVLPTLEEYLLDLDFRLSKLELGI